MMKTEHSPFTVLESLFAALDKACREDFPPGSISAPPVPENPPRFSGAPFRGQQARCEYPFTGSAIEKEFFEICAPAYDCFVLAVFSELPLDREILDFGARVIRAARAAAGGAFSAAGRRAAETAADDRGADAVSAVREAAYKTGRELDRLRGLLRFVPDSRGVYTARCGPDHFTLPLLAPHFTLRFGDTPWVIIDEKRRISLSRAAGEDAALKACGPPSFASATTEGPADVWEDLWKNYHRSVTNETRKNTRLQKQFMPKRYWKYLPEMGNTEG